MRDVTTVRLYVHDLHTPAATRCLGDALLRYHSVDSGRVQEIRPAAGCPAYGGIFILPRTLGSTPVQNQIWRAARGPAQVRKSKYCGRAPAGASQNFAIFR